MLLSNLDLLVTAPGGVARLRELILTLAVQGKLVPQDPSELSADISRIPSAVERLIEEGKVPRSRTLYAVGFSEEIDSLPNGWVSIVASNVFVPRSGNSKLIKGKLFPEPRDHLFPGYSASGQDVWLSDFEYEGTALILSAVGARCGKAFLANGKWSAIANTHIIWPVLDVVLPEYAMLLLNNESYWIRSGGAQPFVKVTETLQQAVYLPPLAEQSRIVTRVEELMRLCDALETKAQLQAAQHAQLVNTLLGTLTASITPQELADNWQRVAIHFDLLLDRPEAVDALEQTILQLAVRGLLVPQDPQDEPAAELLKKIRAEKDRLIAEGKIKRDKPLPPIAEDERLFALPQGWEWVQWGNLTKWMTYGFTRPMPHHDKGVPILTAKNVQYGALDFENVHFTPVDSFAALSPKDRPRKGDILITKDGSIGRTAHVKVETPFCINQSVAVLWMAGLPVNQDYLVLVANAPVMQKRIWASAEGAAIKHISITEFVEFAFPLPPLAEQSRIVTRVAQLRRLCAELRQRLTTAQSTQSHLAQALAEEVI